MTYSTADQYANLDRQDARQERQERQLASIQERITELRTFFSNSPNYLKKILNDLSNDIALTKVKKKALERMANSLSENDNPVLMLVKLKE